MQTEEEIYCKKKKKESEFVNSFQKLKMSFSERLISNYLFIHMEKHYCFHFWVWMYNACSKDVHQLSMVYLCISVFFDYLPKFPQFA